MDIVSEVKRIAPRFSSYIDSRMPYTFHHDMVRTMFPRPFKSRADVALVCRGDSDDDLYAIAFLYLLKNEDGESLLNILDGDEFIAAKQIAIFANSALARIVSDGD